METFWIFISYLIAFLAGIAIELVTAILLNKFHFSKKRVKWKIAASISTSSLNDDNWLENIGTYSGLLDSAYARYKSIENTVIEYGFENEGYSIKVQKFLLLNIKPFLSKYHPLRERLDIEDDKGLRAEFLEDYKKIRKLFIDEFMTSKEEKNA